MLKVTCRTLFFHRRNGEPKLAVTWKWTATLTLNVRLVEKTNNYWHETCLFFKIMRHLYIYMLDVFLHLIHPDISFYYLGVEHCPNYSLQKTKRSQVKVPGWWPFYMSRFNIKQADLASLQAVLSLALSKPFKKSPANVGHSPLPVSETLKIIFHIFPDQRGINFPCESPVPNLFVFQNLKISCCRCSKRLI